MRSQNDLPPHVLREWYRGAIKDDVRPISKIMVMVLVRAADSQKR